MMTVTESIEHVRKLLREYDDGKRSAADLDASLYAHYVEPMLTAIEQGAPYETFSSCCCSAHPPDRVFECTVTIRAHGHRLERIIP